MHKEESKHRNWESAKQSGWICNNPKDLPILHSTAVESELIHRPVVDAIRASPIECGSLCAEYHRLKTKHTVILYLYAKLTNDDSSCGYPTQHVGYRSCTLLETGDILHPEFWSKALLQNHC